MDDIAIDEINDMSLYVQNGDTSSIVALEHNGTTIDSATVTFTGTVTFTDLATEGSTIINGSNIKTGEISADLIGANNGVYIEFKHPLLTEGISGLAALYFGAYTSIYKEDYEAGTTSALCFSSEGGFKFMYQTPDYNR